MNQARARAEDLATEMSNLRETKVEETSALRAEMDKLLAKATSYKKILICLSRSTSDTFGMRTDVFPLDGTRWIASGRETTVSRLI